MKEITFRKFHLDNGVRVVAEKLPSLRSVSIGIWVGAGSRDETEGEDGVSHFVEHMFFKGTSRRSARDIALEIDTIGGELNAFTTRETTTFYAKILDENLPKGIDIISDIFLHSSFSPRDIAKERQVILEEIKMVEDNPEEYIHDLHASMVWDGNPLAHPVLGTSETIKGLKRSTMLKYIDIHYHPDNMVISVAGNFDFVQVEELLNKKFGKFTRSSHVNDRKTPALRGGVWVKKKPTEQVHFCLGTMGLPQNHRHRYTLYALNALLGSSMSSRLFQEIREKRGLVYTIYSYVSSFMDTGIFYIYGATSKEALPRVLRLVMKEISKIKKDGVTRKEIKGVKSQMKGNLMLSLESTSNRMTRLARDEIYMGRYFSPKDIIESIKRITPSSVGRLAQDLFKSEYLSLLVLGPVDSSIIPSNTLDI